jgi:ABC-type transporter Mla subunit MlaD
VTTGTDHGHPELTSREAVAAMLEAFRVDMREHFKGNADELAQIKTGLVTRLEALRDRVSAVEDALAALEVVIAPRLDRLEAALDALDGDQDQAPELGHAAALAAALDRDPADMPPDTCPGGC